MSATLMVGFQRAHGGDHTDRDVPQDAGRKCWSIESFARSIVDLDVLRTCAVPVR
jgi:hypothetical protein